jgi:hypothetical protein
MCSSLLAKSTHNVKIFTATRNQIPNSRDLQESSKKFKPGKQKKQFDASASFKNC